MKRDSLVLVPNEIARSSMSPRERELRSRAAKMLNGAGLLHGSLIARERSCGRRGCRCERGEKHPALYVYRQKDGKLRQLYVGKQHEADVRRWLEQDKQLRALLEEIWEIHWQRAKSRKDAKDKEG